MKKLFLLLTSAGITFSAVAQEASPSGHFATVNTNSNHVIAPANFRGHTIVRNNSGNGARTTSASNSQWYEYLDFMTSSVGAANVGLAYPYLWNDTSSLDAYGASGGGTEYDHNTMVSISYTFDPYFTSWAGSSGNTYTYTSASTVPAAVGYTVDSIGVYGLYGTNPSKTSVVDTLIIGYMYGNGLPYNSASLSDVFEEYFNQAGAAVLFTDYSIPSADTALWFETSVYDSTTNTGAGTTYVQQEIYIRNSSGAGTKDYMGWYDTIPGGVNYKAVALTTPVVVPAGNLMAFTISFKTGDPSYNPANLTTDTVFISDGTTASYKYNMWRPAIALYGSESAPSFWTYDSSDHNGGGFKTLPNFENGWDNVYIPNFAWTAGSGASTLQYPLFDVHAKYIDNLATPVVTNGANQVNVYPNPTSGVVTIAYSLGAAADVSVSLTNVLGQVVNTQKVAGSSNGSVQFNTSNLSDGVYFYTLNANGAVNTGRVVVAH